MLCHGLSRALCVVSRKSHRPAKRLIPPIMLVPVTLAVAASFFSLVNAQALIINTPTPAPGWGFLERLLRAYPILTLSFLIVNGDDRANVLVNFGQLSNTSITWQVTQPVGTNCLFTIRDSTGLVQTSAVFPIRQGSHVLRKAKAALVSREAPPSSTAPPPSGSTTAPPPSGSQLPSSSSPAPSSSRSAPPTGAATALNVPVVAFAAVVGAAFAALF
ncbi:hypothetical protein MIND_00536000 [Mycena indigotica]|uniref:Uncharacterized protein n=1 Tax=Mycena indigotica TaxID=2126181 RepID=A0A8H6SXU0_9AGAR|nr:uncharacterized protein MIND_00536000 [Mycena indigotica]KAF7307416.1 hypothetical protein MIND_00536000 [Mycena indigotica]